MNAIELRPLQLLDEDLEPEDSGVESDFGPAVFQTVQQFMGQIKNPDLFVLFGKRFGEAITIYEGHCQKVYGAKCDPLRHMPFVVPTGSAHNLIEVDFLFKAENNGNTYRIGCR